MKTLISIFGLLACCLPAAAEGPHRVKIVNAAAVMPSKVVENATILIENGRITAVGTDLEEAFEGAEVIDAVNDVFHTCMRPKVGGLTYGEAEELREGIPHTPLKCTRNTERR